MVARFEKGPTQANALDGFDGNAMFQMVPIGGSRGMGAILDASESCVLRVAQPGTARLTKLRTSIGTPISADVPPSGLTLAPDSRVAFDIVGVKTGHTEVRLIGPDGRIRAFVSVSVKDLLIKSVAVVMVADRKRSTNRNPNDALRIIAKADEIFRPQANVGFRPFHPTPLSIFLEQDLGPKIFLERDDHFKPIMQGVLDRRPDFFNADIVLFCCWDVEDSRGDLGGATILGKKADFCFIDDGGSSGDLTTVRIFAHEFGHALKLDHSLKTDHLMFEDTRLMTNSRLDQFEINQANRTGL